MYVGQIVEAGPVAELFETPKHLYTEALISAIPELDLDTIKKFKPLEGVVPSAINPPTGCRFHPRCPYR